MATDTATTALHPEAIPHLPPFVTLPGQTDWLMAVMGVFLLLAVIGVGVFYLKLHALPEHIAHRSQKVQLELVAVLGLISLFTHNHAFWIAGLLLAMLPMPDFGTPLASMAQSLRRMSGTRDPELDGPETPPPASPAAEERDHA